MLAIYQNLGKNSIVDRVMLTSCQAGMVQDGDIQLICSKYFCKLSLTLQRPPCSFVRRTNSIISNVPRVTQWALWIGVGQPFFTCELYIPLTTEFNPEAKFPLTRLH